MNERYYCAAGHPCEAANQRVEELEREKAEGHDETCATERFRLRERIKDWESAHQSQKERANYAEAEHSKAVTEMQEYPAAHPGLSLAENISNLIANLNALADERSIAEAEVRRLEELIAHKALTPEFVTEAQRIREREARNG